MLPIIIAVGVITVAVILWFISTQRRLVVLDENINNAMCQIGMQLSSRFDALIALLNVTKEYAEYESKVLTETAQSHRSVITPESTPTDVLYQEAIISEILQKITLITKQYPELKAEQGYLKALGAVEVFENMVRTSTLIYNASAAKLNRDIRRFPVSVVAEILGFSQRDYLED